MMPPTYQNSIFGNAQNKSTQDHQKTTVVLQPIQSGRFVRVGIPYKEIGGSWRSHEILNIEAQRRTADHVLVHVVSWHKVWRMRSHCNCNDLKINSFCNLVPVFYSVCVCAYGACGHAAGSCRVFVMPATTPHLPATTPHLPATTPHLPATTPHLPATTPHASSYAPASAGLLRMQHPAGLVPIPRSGLMDLTMEFLTSP